MNNIEAMVFKLLDNLLNRGDCFGAIGQVMIAKHNSGADQNY